MKKLACTITGRQALWLISCSRALFGRWFGCWLCADKEETSDIATYFHFKHVSITKKPSCRNLKINCR